MNNTLVKAHGNMSGDELLKLLSKIDPQDRENIDCCIQMYGFPKNMTEKISCDSDSGPIYQLPSEEFLMKLSEKKILIKPAITRHYIQTGSGKRRRNGQIRQQSSSMKLWCLLLKILIIIRFMVTLIT